MYQVHINSHIASKKGHCLKQLKGMKIVDDSKKLVEEINKRRRLKIKNDLYR